MDWNAILNGAMGAGVISIILKLVDTFLNRDKIKADVAKTLVEGGKEAVQAARELVAEQRTEIEEAREARKEQAAEIKELQTGKKERVRRIEDLESQVDNLVRQNETLVGNQLLMEERIAKDMEETQRLRNDYAKAQKQIISAQTQITKLEDTLIRAGEFIDKIKIAVQSIPGVDLPLNGELMDSILRLKAERAKRGKQ
jgi:chromosome segregation ATPase